MLFVLLAVVIIFFTILIVRIPIMIANRRGITGGDLTAISILSWISLIFGFTWIIALILSLVYKSKVNINNTVNGQVACVHYDMSETMFQNSANTRKISMSSDLDLLEKLATLKQKGILTEEEFLRERNKILKL